MRSLIQHGLPVSIALLSACSVIVDGGSYRGRDAGSTSDGGPSPDGGPLRDAAVDAPSGECSPACEEGETCVTGICRCGDGAACQAGSACCNGTCTTLGTVGACTGCSDACADAAHAASSCEATGCTLTCDEGFASCDTTSPDCEQSLSTREHCGGCGTACPATELCAEVAGAPTCVSSCPAGEVACSGACVDTSSDIRHCGGCGSACPEPPGGSAECTGGTCAIGCDPGFGLCGGTTCRALQTYYRDDDGDGYGAVGGVTQLDCPDSPPAGFSATTDDCDDSRATRHPGATETCNALDEDCDGLIDEDFLCTSGDTRTCTITSGACTAAGTQSCVACTWGACVASDVCDRTDDDCDGYVDEGALSTGTGQPILPLGAYRFQAVVGDYNPSRREVGVATASLSGAAVTLYFARLDAATGARIGSATTVATGVGAYAVAWDGQHWTVGVSDTAGVHLYRVDAATGVATRVATLESSGNSVSVARMGTSGSNIIVAWSASGVGRIARFSMPSGAAAAPTPIGSASAPIPAALGSVHYARATSTASGALVFYMVTTTGGGPYDLHIGPATSTSVGPFARQLSSVSEMFAAYEPTTNAVGLALSLYVGGSSSAVFRTVSASGTLLSPELTLSGPSAAGVAYGGEPGQLAAFSGMYYPSSGGLARIRAADGMRVPSGSLSVGGFNGMVGVPEGAARFLYFEDDSVNLKAFPVVCSP